MRTTLVTVLAVGALAISGAATVSGAPLQRPATPQVAASYVARVEFSGSLLVSWSFEYASEEQECTAWASGRGGNRFRATSLRPAKGLVQLYRRGHSGQLPWAGLSVLGKAKGTMERWITVDAGGVNWVNCPGTRPARPVSVDCGERSFPRMVGSLRATNGEFTRTLDPPGYDPNDPDRLAGFNELVLFNITPGREPFTSCNVPAYAKRPPYAEFALYDAALNVTASDWNALRTLRRNRSHRLEAHYGGRCTKAYPPATCSFVLDLTATVTRVT